MILRFGSTAILYTNDSERVEVILPTICNAYSHIAMEMAERSEVIRAWQTTAISEVVAFLPPIHRYFLKLPTAMFTAMLSSTALGSRIRMGWTLMGRAR